MLESFFDLLKNFNDNYAQAALFFIALFSLFVAYNEFVVKTRPYVLPEITVQQRENGEWHFFVALVNKGDRPGVGRITKAILKIGDEKHPTLFETDTVLSPNETRSLQSIGHINELGRSRIKKGEYISNNVTIFLEIESRSIGDKKFKYKTTEEYRIDVTGEKPLVILIKEDLN